MCPVMVVPIFTRQNLRKDTTICTSLSSYPVEITYQRDEPERVVLLRCELATTKTESLQDVNKDTGVFEV